MLKVKNAAISLEDLRLEIDKAKVYGRDFVSLSTESLEHLLNVYEDCLSIDAVSEENDDLREYLEDANDEISDLKREVNELQAELADLTAAFDGGEPIAF